MMVLDVGCGDGYFSLGMARMVGMDGKVVSVDLQAEAIRNLEMRATKAGLSDRMDMRVCSDNSLAIDDLGGQLDFALAFYVVHHAADVPMLMTQINEALKPKGTFLIVEPGHHATADECKATETTSRQSGFSLVDHPKVTRDWAALFEKN
jgi:2-polyprenyl-3-methyl-5-hydroxy-6-metoxy-1,4-benzoquinol methylase